MAGVEGGGGNRPAPILIATASSGERFEDPSEDLLFELLLDIEQGVETFCIVARLGDPAGQTYAQVMRNEDGSWLVERREGSADRHFSAELRDRRDAHRALTTWAHELDLDPPADHWHRVAF